MYSALGKQKIHVDGFQLNKAKSLHYNNCKNYLLLICLKRL